MIKILQFILLIFSIYYIHDSHAVSLLRQNVLQNFNSSMTEIQLDSITPGTHTSTDGSIETNGKIDKDEIGVSGNIIAQGNLKAQANLTGTASTGSDNANATAKGEIAAKTEAFSKGTIGGSLSLTKGADVKATGEVGANGTVYMAGEASASAGEGVLSARAQAQGDLAAKVSAHGSGTAEATATWDDGLKAGVFGIIGANGTVHVTGSGAASVGNDVLGANGQVKGEASADVKARAEGGATVLANIKDGIKANVSGNFDASVKEQAEASGDAEVHFLDCSKQISLCGSAKGTVYEKGQAHVSGNGGAQAGLSLAGAGVNASGQVEAAASVEAGLEGHIVVNNAQATIQAKAMAQAYAKAQGTAAATYDFKHMKGSIGLQGSAVAAANVQAEVHGSATIGKWLKADGQLSISYGAQVGVGGGFVLSEDGCTFIYSGQLQGRAAVGVSGSGNVEVNPCELVTEVFEDVEAAAKQIVQTDAKIGEQCLWGPNCADFTSLGKPGVDCCGFKCSNRVESNGVYDCEDGVLNVLSKINSLEANAACSTGAECKGFTFAGQGMDCCDGTCQPKVQDWAGLFFCPNVALTKRALGESCKIGPQCDGYQLAGAGANCCDGVCAQRVQDWAGLYFCPSVALTKKPLGGDCKIPQQCDGYTLLGAGSNCCNGVCKSRVQDWAGVYYCPENALTKKSIGESCQVSQQCDGFTALGAGSQCCDGTCQNRVQDWAGFYYCPGVAVLKKSIGESCTVGGMCDGYAVLGDGTDCCSGKCAQRIKDWAGVYYCPEKAVLKKPIGESCILGAECQDYSFANDGVECCWFKCQRRVEKSGLFGIRYWSCP